MAMVSEGTSPQPRQLFLRQHSTTDQVDQVLRHFRCRFIKEVDAQHIVFGLEHEGIISNAILTAVNKESDTTRQNEILYAHLERTSTMDSLTAVCDTIIAVQGHPKMKKLGKVMKGMLTGLS